MFNRLEQDVLDALSGLPDEYSVKPRPLEMSFVRDGVSYHYEPDFVVEGPHGRKLIVEVKSLRSLSLANLAKLSVISQQAQAEGRDFIVLVPDARPSDPLRSSLLGAQDLHIVRVGERSEIPGIIVGAFDDPGR
jgi:hypothetical protein